MKRKKLIILGCVLVLIVLTFGFLLPINSIKGIDTESNVSAVTCVGYITSDGLPNRIDSFKKFHILKGDLPAYLEWRKQAIDSRGQCVGGLKIIKAQLFL